jgi:FimV-like protein
MAKMINGDVAVLDEESSFEKVHDKIGAINSQEESENKDDSIFGLTPKEHQYYVDELNLARLYFETGDNEEALRIIEDVREHGSPDLIEEIEQILENYNS